MGTGVPPHQTPESTLSTIAAAALLFVLSGSVLLLEILAARLLAPIVGLSLETYTAIIGVVLAGIATGYAAGGKLADKYRWRAVLGPAVAVGGMWSFAALPLMDRIGAGSGRPGVGEVLLLAFAGFFVPTAALSVASPTLTKARLRTVAEAGSVVGWLSAASTLGALSGTFVTGLVLIGRFPTSRILYWVAGGLVVLGVVLCPWTRSARIVSGTALGIALAGLGASGALADRCPRDTRYYCARVRVAGDTPNARTLQLDRLRQGYVDMVDPTRLGFRFQRVLAAALPGVLGPDLAVLHVGGGAFAFPRYVAASRPGSRNTVFEIDPKLPVLAEELLGLDRSEINVVAGDGRALLRAAAPGTFDFVVMDALGSLDPPWHLTTAEAAKEVRDLLTAGGIYAVNAVDAGGLRFARAEARTMASVFRYVAVVLSPPGRNEVPSNTVILASDSPIQAPVGLADGRILTAGEFDRFVGGSPILRDDYAPVERLIARSGR